MKLTYVKTQSQRPSKFFYKVEDGSHKHPYVRKECVTCGKRSMQKTESKGFCSRACAKVGELNPQWNPESIYRSVDQGQLVRWHVAVYAARGNPMKCAHCATTEERMYHWANVSGSYEDVSDYIRLCVPCHSRFDRAKRETP